MIPRHLTDPGQLCLGARSDPCNYSHEFFIAPRHRIRRYTTSCRGNFSPCEQNTKSCHGARVVLRMLIINVWNNFSNKKFQKAPEIGQRV